MGAQTYVSKWGTSLAIRISKSIAERWDVQAGSVLEIIPCSKYAGCPQSSGHPAPTRRHLPRCARAQYRPDAMSGAADPNEAITEQEFVRPVERGLYRSQ